ncbi:MAG: DUF885 domain-containing protein, partial [Pseudomonadota bacterium]
MHRAALLFTLSLVLTVSPAGADDAPFESLLADHWAHFLETYPLKATANGVADYNDRLGSVTPAASARVLARERAFLTRLRRIDTAQLDAGERVSHGVLHWLLQDSIRAAELDTARIPFNNFSGFFTDVLSMADGVPMQREADYEAYIARLRDVPRHFDEHIANLRRGIDSGFVLPRVVVEGVQPTVAAEVRDDPTGSRLYEPFERLPESLPAATRQRLADAGSAAIRDAVTPAFRRLSEFLRQDYLAAATTTLGATELPGGEDYYAHQIRRYVTVTDLDADAIHSTGLDEVARIRAEMDAVIERTGFDGDFAAFTAFLRSDPKFYAASADELLAAAAYTAKRIDYVMPGYFGRLPRLPYGVVPVPDEIAPNYTTASYDSAPIGGTRGGGYWVNTYALDQRPLYELTALTLHEAVPGHHHQIALAQELDNLPPFRRNLYFSAFGEGWALYTEKLGVEMGVYRNDYEHFGRLSYEMWRACRLVIDTGLHAMGWPRERAIAYLKDNTSLAEANVRAEVDHY